MTASLEDSLAHQPFLADLTRYQLEAVARCAAPVSFPANQFIFHEGDEAEHFYILTQGRVAVEVVIPGRPPINIQTLGPNEVLGWSWFYPPYRWHFDALALTATEAIAFEANGLLRLCNHDAEVGYKLTKRYAHLLFERLQATRLQLLDVYEQADVPPARSAAPRPRREGK
ncbi:MAG TPA: cyclic nucleotide-binding domain-containing protein [Chloroflexia bacterium]|nr:cyclic nucleotide-binding domain-containing protein [Chloroflexia bacterium]